MTKDHILMFAKADELQKVWKPEVGDRTIFGERIRPYEFAKLYFITNEIIDTVRRTQHEKDFRFIFLPSTDQLAEMWGEAKGGEYDFFLPKIAKFAIKKNLLNYPLPIIVLAFIMSDLYGLKWNEDGKEWLTL